MADVEIEHGAGDSGEDEEQRDGVDDEYGAHGAAEVVARAAGAEGEEESCTQECDQEERNDGP